MKCPICGSDANSYFFLTSCRKCKAFKKDLFLFRATEEVAQGWWYCAGLSCHLEPDGGSLPDTYLPAVAEMQKIVNHSEWYKWVEVVDDALTHSKRPDIPFQLSLFADWCAENGFPLQEQAVRQRLSRG